MTVKLVTGDYRGGTQPIEAELYVDGRAVAIIRREDMEVLRFEITQFLNKKPRKVKRSWKEKYP